MLVGILLSVAASACFPYLYYLASNVKLDPTLSLGLIFVVSLVIAFGILAFSSKIGSLKPRKPGFRTPAAPKSATVPAQTRFCRNCGSRVAVEDKFCAECGTTNT
jgi:hypothetical protein